MPRPCSELAADIAWAIRHLENGVELLQPGSRATILRTVRDYLYAAAMNRVETSLQRLTMSAGEIFLNACEINSLTIAQCIAEASEANYEIVVSISIRPNETTPWSNFYVRIPDREVPVVETQNPRSD